eukprot:TRINITY_DN7643_c0_g1_i1.p1 TRINITY_DN7643_c0_g1~~TRINITY_DN7643_c0_g1_i1.p1  ORF type:complete len:127 (+),score=9.96 TRINITY_DN7643_c0_g1_i1:147-527(+)
MDAGYVHSPYSFAGPQPIPSPCPPSEGPPGQWKGTVLSAPRKPSTDLFFGPAPPYCDARTAGASQLKTRLTPSVGTEVGARGGPPCSHSIRMQMRLRSKAGGTQYMCTSCGTKWLRWPPERQHDST